MQHTNNKKTIKILNDLIETNIDRIKGYETAANNTKDNELKSLCEENILQSSNFRNELEKLVINAGGKPTTSSSASGAVYRAWMNIKATVLGDDKKAIYAMCEKGEDSAKKDYLNAKKESELFDQKIISIINAQYDQIVNAHDRVHSLRDSVTEVHH